MLNLIARLGLDGSGFELGMKRAESSSKKFANNLGGELKGKLAAFLTVAAAEEFGRKVVETASRINDLSEALGISTDEFQQWEYAAGQAGGTAENVQKFFDSLAASRDQAINGDLGAMRNFKKFGVKPEDLLNLNNQDLGLKIANAFKNGDPQALTSALKEIGGKGALALRAAFKAGIEDMFKDAPLIKTEDIIKLDNVGDEFDRLGKRIVGGGASFFAAFGKSALLMADQIELKYKLLYAFLSSGLHFNPAESMKEFAGKSKQIIEAQAKEVQARAEREKTAVDAVKNRGKGSIPTVDNDRKKPYVTYESPYANEKSGGGVDSGRHINSLQQIGALVSGSGPNSDMKTLSQELRLLRDQLKRNEKIDEYRYKRTAGSVRISSSASAEAAADIQY